ncbi:MAG: hypothetical protein NDJ72_10865 [Elusimicrobia bacterium]|nr:hypothetical protein [Elusimicrobiota bacterium]
MRSGKADTLITHGHPAWVEQLGGPEKARAAFPALLGREINALYAKGFTKVDYAAGEPKLLREGGPHIFAIIPLTTTAEGKKGTITSLGHMLAIKNERAKDRWRLIRLGLPEEEMRRLIPELPKDVKLPAPRKAVFKERVSKE